MSNCNAVSAYGTVFGIHKSIVFCCVNTIIHPPGGFVKGYLSFSCFIHDLFTSGSYSLAFLISALMPTVCQLFNFDVQPRLHRWQDIGRWLAAHRVYDGITGDGRKGHLSLPYVDLMQPPVFAG